MCDFIKRGACHEPCSTYTFTPIAFEAVTNPLRLASGVSPHARENLQRNRPPSKGNFWMEDRCQTFCRACEDVQHMTHGGGSPRKNIQPQGSNTGVMLMCMILKQIHPDWPQASVHKQESICTTENFNYDPKADLHNWLTQAHAVFTCHTATQPFVQTLSPGHNTGMLATVSYDQMPHILFCMGHLWIAPTMHI
ncbi:hypothetical protein O181_016353 [Austropuccinia psidii MF-1]|uniref:Uncharacterized protein n=1 Tax=Austropuccinia psidii MF-1 TaxID=1389203 RepID=A0A9Q3C4Z0_9BASI|nr:hypothetical protein [Austropuccinia psidii MF-1]